MYSATALRSKIPRSAPPPVGGHHRSTYKPPPIPVGGSTAPDSYVRPGLPAVDGDAGTVEKACLLRADERDHVGHLLHHAKSPQRHLGAHERVDPFRIR